MGRHRTPQAREALAWEKNYPGWVCEHRRGVYWAIKHTSPGAGATITAPSLKELGEHAKTHELASLIWDGVSRGLLPTCEKIASH